MNDKVTISLFELASRYPTDDSARIFLEEQRWHGQPVCPYCGTIVNQHKHYHKGEQGYYHCSTCNQVTPILGWDDLPTYQECIRAIRRADDAEHPDELRAYEREIITERIRDKVAAAKKKGMHTGGFPPVGYAWSRSRICTRPCAWAPTRG